MTLGDGLADDLFRTAESIDRSGIDEIDAMLDRRSDRGNGFRLLGSTPHPAADGPGAQSHTRHFKRRAGDGGTFHLDFAGFGFTSHGLAPSSPRAASAFFGLLASEPSAAQDRCRAHSRRKLVGPTSCVRAAPAPKQAAECVLLKYCCD